VNELKAIFLQRFLNLNSTNHFVLQYNEGDLNVQLDTDQDVVECFRFFLDLPEQRNKQRKLVAIPSAVFGQAAEDAGNYVCFSVRIPKRIINEIPRIESLLGVGVEIASLNSKSNGASDGAAGSVPPVPSSNENSDEDELEDKDYDENAEEENINRDSEEEDSEVEEDAAAGDKRKRVTLSYDEKMKRMERKVLEIGGVDSTVKDEKHIFCGKCRSTLKNKAFGTGNFKTHFKHCDGISSKVKAKASAKSRRREEQPIATADLKSFFFASTFSLAEQEMKKRSTSAGSATQVEEPGAHIEKDTSRGKSKRKTSSSSGGSRSAASATPTSGSVRADSS
jgi:hypothetical protein